MIMNTIESSFYFLKQQLKVFNMQDLKVVYRLAIGPTRRKSLKIWGLKSWSKPFKSY